MCHCQSFIPLTMTSTNEDDLLKILQAHGQQFLDSFSDETSDSKKRKINLSPLPPRKKIQHTPSSTDNEDDEEEWLGIAGGSDYARQLGSEDDGGIYWIAMLDIHLNNVQILNRTMIISREKAQITRRMLQCSRISPPKEYFPVSRQKPKWRRLW